MNRTVMEQLKLAEELLAELQRDTVRVTLSRRIRIREYFSEHQRGALINRSRELSLTAEYVVDE